MKPIPASTASLYVLVFPALNLIKIGKANNIHVRSKKLRQSWGSPDYEASYELTAPQSTIVRLEKSLHFMLSAHRPISVTTGDGHTEMFSMEALEAAILHIELFAASSLTPMALKKGIPVPSHVRQEQPAGQDLSGLGVGAIGHIGVMAWAVYCIVQAEAKVGEIRARPSTQRIADMVGASHDTVHRALSTLTTAGMLRIEKAPGVKNSYSWSTPAVQ